MSDCRAFQTLEPANKEKDQHGRESLQNTRLRLNPLTAGVAYIRVFIFYQHIKNHILNMLKIKCGNK